MYQHRIGQYLYRFGHGEKHSKNVVISAHGLKPLIFNKTFMVPKGTRIVFYGIDNRFLIDPGAEDVMWRRFEPVEIYEEGTECPNYVLTKYQGYHETGLGASFPSLYKLKKKFKGVSDEDFETYLSLAVMSKWEMSTEEFEKRFKKLNEALKTDQDVIAIMKERVNAKDSKYNQDRLAESIQFLRATEKRIKDLQKHPMDLLTIRYRQRIGLQSSLHLSEVLRKLAKYGKHYEEIHCSFCRGSMVDALWEKFGGKVVSDPDLRSVSAEYKKEYEKKANRTIG